MAAYDLMVIDDFGLMDLDIEKCRDLFEIIESRDCRKATADCQPKRTPVPYSADS